jgi:hypothetical protein
VSIAVASIPDIPVAVINACASGSMDGGGVELGVTVGVGVVVFVGVKVGVTDGVGVFVIVGVFVGVTDGLGGGPSDLKSVIISRMGLG